MYAIYAFCREVDDIADLPGEAAAKKLRLAAWREEIGRLYQGCPGKPTAQALLTPVQRFALPQAEFLAVIDGVEIDAEPVVRMRNLADLMDYCRKVAGAVGMLSVHAFGVPDQPGPRIAESLGGAMQLTNVLRDLKEDAAAGRFYVPLDMLAEHGIATSSPDAAFEHPGFASVCEELADLARGHFREAGRLIAGVGSRRLRPAAVMMSIYRETLERLEARGWQRIEGPIRLSSPRKMWLALRHGLL